MTTTTERREALLVQAANVLRLVPRNNRVEAARLLDELISSAMEHGAGIANEVVRAGLFDAEEQS